ncbi:MAG: hypothetical protein HGA22_00300, partial [Clostridiales bacterium]|nr:hypothetical protein [Clostridiales bacterium]
KDGPSAGITLATALVSALTGLPVRRNVAMTGEITLRGRVLPIGGLKEKVLAAHRAGVDTIIVPIDNKKDIDDIPEKIREKIRFILAADMDTVLNAAIVGKKTSALVFDAASVPQKHTEQEAAEITGNTDISNQGDITEPKH